MFNGLQIGMGLGSSPSSLMAGGAGSGTLLSPPIVIGPPSAEKTRAGGLYMPVKDWGYFAERKISEDESSLVDSIVAFLLTEEN